MYLLLTTAIHLGQAGVQPLLTIATDNGKADSCYSQRQVHGCLAAANCF